MVECENISTGISGVYYKHSNSVIICQSLYTIKINLPTFVGKKIEMTDLEIAECSPYNGYPGLGNSMLAPGRARTVNTMSIA